MKKFGYIFIVMITVISAIVFYTKIMKKEVLFSESKTTSITKEKKRVLFVNSYHRGYQWSDGIYNSILEKFKIVRLTSGELDFSNSLVDLNYIEMDTKRKTSENDIKEAALSVKKRIEEWKPHLVIASDDNASKYVISKFYSDTTLPFVFCGVNWSAKEYNFSPDNVTGMIEVQLIDQIITNLKKYAKGDRVSFLKGDDESSRKEAKFFEEYFKIKLDVRLVKNFNEWKNEYIKLQKESDMILIGNSASVKDWNSSEAKKIIKNNTEIPTGNWDSWMKEFALLSVSNKASEQGEWAAETSLKILNGTSINSIAIVKNRKASLMVNMTLAKEMNIKFPHNILDYATIFHMNKPKVLFINSYHKGYEWSDMVEVGLLKGFKLKIDSNEIIDTSKSVIDLKIVRMDTKINKSESFKKSAAKKVLKIVKDWKPDLIIASDDNASKYVIKPYLSDSKTPVLFCGVNWDASVYGFPTKNVRGMVEIDPIHDVIDKLKKYSKGERIGCLGYESFSERKNIQNYKKIENVEFNKIYLVEDFTQWKSKFKKLQSEVDMIILFNHVGIKKWDDDSAKSFVLNNVKVPIGSFVKFNSFISLMGTVKVAEEQGWWSAITALDIFAGKSIEDVKSVKNRESQLILNMTLAEILKIKFPVELLNDAIIVK